MIGSGLLAKQLVLAIFMVTISEWFYLWILCAFKRPKAPNEHTGRVLPALLLAFIAALAILAILAVLSVALTLLFFSFYDARKVDLSLLLLGPLIPALGIIYSKKSRPKQLL